MATVLAQGNVIDDLNIRYERDAPLGPLTWYGVGGNAEVLAHPSSVQQLAALAARCRDTDTPVYVLGSGANLLVADSGVKGIVVRLDDPCFKRCEQVGNTFTVGAGYDLAKLVLETAKAGVTGLEGLAGIPATVGGAVRMNAGGAFGDIGQAVKRVMVCDATGQIYYRDRDDLVFAYRSSNIAARYILEVDFELRPGDPEQLMRRVKEVFLFKKNTQPLRDSSAGCAFKNPAAATGVQPGEKVSAGSLIERAGLKGYRVGEAEISTHHANFIVAHPGATAADILSLLMHVKRTVAERFGVELEREVVVWPQ